MTLILLKIITIVIISWILLGIIEYIGMLLYERLILKNETVFASIFLYILFSPLLLIVLIFFIITELKHKTLKKIRINNKKS